MAITKIFEYRSDDRSGYTGWIPKGAPREFNSGGGMLVAHDVLEHTRDTTSSWEDELMALGALIFIRGETGYFSGRVHNPSWGGNMVGDLMNCMRFSLYHRDIETKRTHRLDEGTEDELKVSVNIKNVTARVTLLELGYDDY